MVLRQHTPPKLKRYLLHYKSILVPPEIRVRVGEITHRFAWSRKRHATRQTNIITHTTSYQCLDGSQAAHDAETQAFSLSAKEHLGAAQSLSTCWRDCPLRRLQKRRELPSKSNNRIRTAPICGWLSGSTRRKNSRVFSFIARASWCRPRSE